MSNDTSTERDVLLARIDSAFGETADVLKGFRAVAGPADLKGFGPIAEKAREKLRNDRDAILTDEEHQALELALRMTRPAPLVEDGAIGALDPALGGTAFPGWAAFAALVKPMLRSIGRLDRAANQSHVGTGFLVAPDLVMTNAHVLSQLSYGTNRLRDGQAVIRFSLEKGADSPMESVPIRRAIGPHPSADLALLLIDPLPGLPIVELSATPVAGESVVAVGFPGADFDRNPYFIPILFPGTLGLKRAAPGVLRAAATGGMSHDCSTLGGNSGSPLFSLATGKAVAVHNSGIFMWQNGAVPAAVAAAFIKQQGR